MNFTAEVFVHVQPPVDPMDISKWSLDYSKRVYRQLYAVGTGYVAHFDGYSINMTSMQRDRLAHMIAKSI